MELGTTRGSGSWGVSTLTINPVTGQPYISFFPTESQAIAYARRRALQTGSPTREGGRVMYVVHGDDVRYRVLRGMRGGRQRPGGGVSERQEQILVFEAAGLLPNNSIRWVLQPHLTVDITDRELEMARRERERLRIEHVERMERRRPRKE